MEHSSILKLKRPQTMTKMRNIFKTQLKFFNMLLSHSPPLGSATVAMCTQQDFCFIRKNRLWSFVQKRPGYQIILFGLLLFGFTPPPSLNSEIRGRAWLFRELLGLRG